MRRLFRTWFFASLLLAAWVSPAQSLPDGPGKNETMDKCNTCHGIEIVAGVTQSREQWDTTIGAMINRGADIDDATAAIILDYLGAYLSPKPAKINVNKAAAKELETGLEISAKEAEAIVKYRDQHGAFKDWRELTKVDGVDARKIEAKKDVIALE